MVKSRFATPSFLRGMGYEEELLQRSFGCEVLCEAGILLALPLVTVATAQTLLQRFYYVKAIQKYSVREMLPACVLAATKLEETHVDCRSILNVLTFLLQRRDKVPTEPINIYDREYGRSKEKMFMCERKLLKSLGFRVYMDHPHRYILPFLKILDCHQNRELAQSAWNFLNDSLRTTLCVQYAPYVVAATAIYLAARIIKKALPDGWWSLCEATLEQIEDCSLQILSLYKKPIS